MRFAYADPPYFGCAVRLYGDHPEAHVYDTLDGHKALIERLCSEFTDGWALSMTSGNLRAILPLCPDDVRVMAWVRSAAAPHVSLSYSWEPVVLRGGRRARRQHKKGETLIRDWQLADLGFSREIVGHKPIDFCVWIFEALGMLPTDDFVDIFHGSGAVAAAHEKWQRQQRLFA